MSDAPREPSEAAVHAALDWLETEGSHWIGTRTHRRDVELVRLALRAAYAIDGVVDPEHLDLYRAARNEWGAQDMAEGPAAYVQRTKELVKIADLVVAHTAEGSNVAGARVVDPELQRRLDELDDMRRFRKADGSV